MDLFALLTPLATMPTLEPATDLDSNVWYQLSELAVDDNDGDFKSMLQPTAPGGDLRVGAANKQSYWQFVCNLSRESSQDTNVA